MKRILIILPLLVLFMCSWVDPDTIDTYDGSIVFVSSDYDVTRLSGRIEYYLMDYGHLGLSDDGSLLNGSSSTISGVALINGTEYSIRFSSNGGLQIQQYYTYNSITRSTWVDYKLYSDVIPTPFSYSDLAPIFVFFLVFMIIPLSFYRGVLS